MSAGTRVKGNDCGRRNANGCEGGSRLDLKRVASKTRAGSLERGNKYLANSA